MFSLTQRFQQTSNQAITCASVVSIFIIATFWAQLYHNNVFSLSSQIANVKPQINLRTSRFYGSVNGKPKENLRIAFDLDADLTPLFNWNTKQVFVYLTGSYNDTKSSSISSEVTFWDKIITEKADAHVILKNVKSKYAIWDAKDKISEKDLNIKLHWNIQPWVGTLVYGETTGEILMTTPAYKKNSAKQRAPQKDASN